MAEEMTAHARRNPLRGLVLPHRVGRLEVRDAGPATRYICRSGGGAVSTAFGVALPTTPCRAATSGARAALWLGPDEWLLIAPEADALALRSAFAGLEPGGRLVDVSHRNAALIIEGSEATDVLAIGCPLDLDPDAFPVGMCTRTILAKAEIVLWRQGEARFRLEAWRSFMPYVAGLLGEAARDLASD